MIQKGEWAEGSYDQRCFIDIICSHLCDKHRIMCEWCILNSCDFWKMPLKDLLIKKGAEK